MRALYRLTKHYGVVRSWFGCGGFGVVGHDVLRMQVIALRAEETWRAAIADDQPR